jgi:hypothetical protein
MSYQTAPVHSSSQAYPPFQSITPMMAVIGYGQAKDSPPRPSARVLSHHRQRMNSAPPAPPRNLARVQSVGLPAANSQSSGVPQNSRQMFWKTNVPNSPMQVCKLTFLDLVLCDVVV